MKSFLLFNIWFHFSSLYGITQLNSIKESKSGPEICCTLYFVHCLYLTTERMQQDFQPTTNAPTLLNHKYWFVGKLSASGSPLAVRGQLGTAYLPAESICYQMGANIYWLLLFVLLLVH